MSRVLTVDAALALHSNKSNPSPAFLNTPIISAGIDREVISNLSVPIQLRFPTYNTVMSVAVCKSVRLVVRVVFGRSVWENCRWLPQTTTLCTVQCSRWNSFFSCVLRFPLTSTVFYTVQWSVSPLKPRLTPPHPWTNLLLNWTPLPQTKPWNHPLLLLQDATNARCVYFSSNGTDGAWLSDGLESSFDNDSKTVTCSSRHMTSFAVIMTIDATTYVPVGTHAVVSTRTWGLWNLEHEDILSVKNCAKINLVLK